MADELVPLEDETGEYEDTYEVSAGVPADTLSPVLVILTSIFLIISIVMIAIRLHTSYDLGKTEGAVKQRIRKISGGK